MKNFRIQETIRHLLHLIPSDPSIIDVLDKVAIGRSATSYSAAAVFDASRPSSTFGSAPFNRNTLSGAVLLNTSPLKGKHYSIIYALFNKQTMTED